MNKKNLNKLIKSTIENYGLTSDTQLKDLATKLNIKLNYVGFINNLENIKEDGGYIINLGDETGTHWTCFYKENDKLFYFDSYAVPFENELIDLARKSGIKDIIYNDYYQMQGLTENLCGIYCIMFLYHMTQKGTNKRSNKKKSLIDRFKEFTKGYEDLDKNYSSGSSLNL